MRLSGRFIGLVLAATTLLAAGPASAQWRDPSWTGFYIGGHLGGSWGSYRGGDATGQWSWGHGGFLGGGHLGYNLQLASVVLGVEADFALTNAEGNSQPLLGVDVKTETDYLGSIRGRLGWSLGQLMLYGTAGYAYGGVHTSIRTPIISVSNTDAADGWVYGGGLEYKFTSWLSGRMELLHYELSRSEVDRFGFRVDTDLSQTVGRLGVTFHFN